MTASPAGRQGQPADGLELPPVRVSGAPRGTWRTNHRSTSGDCSRRWSASPSGRTASSSGSAAIPVPLRPRVLRPRAGPRHPRRARQFSRLFSVVGYQADTESGVGSLGCWSDLISPRNSLTGMVKNSLGSAISTRGQPVTGRGTGRRSLPLRRAVRIPASTCSSVLARSPGARSPPGGAMPTRWWCGWSSWGCPAGGGTRRPWGTWRRSRTRRLSDLRNSGRVQPTSFDTDRAVLNRVLHVGVPAVRRAQSGSDCPGRLARATTVTAGIWR